MKFVIDSDIPFIRGVLEPFAEVVYLKGDAISSRDVADADALVVRTRTECGRALLEGSRVKFIATATIGYDHIDTDYCRAAGIAVATAAGSNARGVLQWIGAALAYVSGQQGWSPDEKYIGVVGVGNVGSLVAAYALLWGFRVLCCDPPRERAGCGNLAPSPVECMCGRGLYRPDEFVPFERIVSECDIVTFHTPLIREGADATFHMADPQFFRRIVPGALILNSSRGEVIDTAALSAAADDGRCSCCIDTWENESAIDRTLLGQALLSTPHIAGYTAQGKANATAMSVRALASRFGLPLTDWYPYGDVPKAAPRPICWEELTGTVNGRFDIAAESRRLKEDPASFEQIRNGYAYRTEYF